MALLQIGLALGQMALRSWLGGQKQTRESRLSPEAQQILNDLFAEYRSGEAPAGVTAPFVRGAKNIQQRFSRRAGASAKEHTILQSEAYTPMAEAVSRYREGLRAQIAQILSGTGTQETETGPDISSILGGGIDEIAYGLGLEKPDDEETTTTAGRGLPKFGQQFDLSQIPTTLGGSLGKKRWSRSSLRFRPQRRKPAFSFGRY